MMLRRALAAEAIGTALLLAIIVGSGIMGERLAGGNAAVALLANSLATGCGLWVLIVIFAPISGAHFNPLVSLVVGLHGGPPWPRVALYAGVQLAAAFIGVALAHAMFELPLFSASHHVRTGAGQWLAEFVATGGLVMTVLLARGRGPLVTGGLVAAYITSAYWFTASTSFANPAVTLARAATDSFAGLRPADVAGFVLAQTAGALAAMLAAGWLLKRADVTHGFPR